MFDRSEPALKWVCILLAALLVYQCSRIFLHRDPLARVSIPALPTLAEGEKSTNAPAKPTNSVSGAGAAKGGTNVANAESPGTKSGDTNKPAQAAGKSGTNPVAATVANKGETNAALAPEIGKAATNSTPPKNIANGGTNAVPNLATNKPGTTVAAATPGKRGNGPGGRGGRGGGLPGVGADVSPEIKARIEKIYQSELFGQVQHPMPPALMGIAGNQAFLRASSGQTGTVKEGDDMGGLKLLKIGVNRVLIEEEGEQKELTIFSGFGGESLMSKTK